MMKKKNKLIDMAYNDTRNFLINDTQNWGKEKNSGSFVAYGLLNAVFEVLFSLAPSKEAAMEIIQMSLINFIDEEDPNDEYDPNTEAECEDEYKAVEEYEKNKEGGASGKSDR